MAFLETPVFPECVAASSTGGPRWASKIVVGLSGFEQRITHWANMRHEYNVGTGIKYLDDLEAVKDIFLAASGQVHGFRFKDHQDCKSSPVGAPITPVDQQLGVGDAVGTVDFQLVKTYTAGLQYTRTIAKPVAGTVRVALDAMEHISGWSVDTTTGLITFDTAPGDGVVVTAGFEFDVPVRFNTDTLTTQLEHYQSGQLQVPLIEIRL